MPRTQRMIINDQSTVYHAWDVEPIPTVILPFNHIML
jgi:hypothetical protein